MHAKGILDVDGLRVASIPKGDSDAHSGLGDFGDRDGLNRVGGGPEVRSGLSGLPARVQPGVGGRLLRMQLHVAVSVQRVGIGLLGTVPQQSIFRERASACGGNTLPASSPRLLILRPLFPAGRGGRCGSLIPRQLPLSPMMRLAVRSELANVVPIQRSHDARSAQASSARRALQSTSAPSFPLAIPAPRARPSEAL
jgi:hypothetical protein